ncbi:hypothetical protein HK103_005082 [Boothiomyces macroporosus]|uniref:Uncharacterized protein n=1 Tax=Boothiomyces macroporosus TaxID=261099 RepID=A0AAD5UFI0_9FUNG|nr:hypothetical protein HK103_005082 [Boothiomyces macroporosus]
MNEALLRANAKIGKPLNVGVLSIDIPAVSRLKDSIFLNALQKTVVDKPHLVFGNESKVLTAKKLSDVDLECVIQDAPKVFSMEVLANEEMNSKIKSTLGWKIRVVQGKMWIKESVRVVSLYLCLTSEFHVLDGYSTSIVLKQYVSNMIDIINGKLSTSCFENLHDIIVTPAPIEKNIDTHFSAKYLLFSIWLAYQHFRKSAKTVFYGRPRKDIAKLEHYELDQMKTESRFIALTPKELYAIQEEIKNTNLTTTSYLIAALLTSYRGMMDAITKKPAGIKNQSVFSSVFKIVPIAFMIALCSEFGVESTAWFTCLLIMMVFFYFPKLLKEPRIPNYQNFTVVLDRRIAEGAASNTLGNYSTVFSYFMHKHTKRSYFWDKVSSMKKFLSNCKKSIVCYEGILKTIPNWIVDEYIHRAPPNYHRDYSFMLSYLGKEDWGELPVNDYFFGTNSIWTGNRHVMQLSACRFENRMNILITYPSKLVERYQVDIFVDSLRQVINNSIYDQKITVENTLNP